MRRKRDQPWGSSVPDPHSRLIPRLLSCFCHPYLQPQWTISSAAGPLSAHNNTSNELILLLWQRTGDLGHAALAPSPLALPPFGHLKTHPAVLLHNLTLSFSGDFPQRYVCVRLVWVCLYAQARGSTCVWTNVWVRMCPLCAYELFIYFFCR